jgi:sulfite reductase alpha subunit-like flavoprotein
MDFGRVRDLCQRLDQLAAILEIMEDESINVDLYREASDALNEAISEIECLQSDADLNRETSNALRDALAESERLRSETADLQHTKSDGGPSNRNATSNADATDWFTRFLDRKRALTSKAGR